MNKSLFIALVVSIIFVLGASAWFFLPSLKTLLPNGLENAGEITLNNPNETGKGNLTICLTTIDSQGQLGFPNTLEGVVSTTPGTNTTRVGTKPLPETTFGIPFTANTDFMNPKNQPETLCKVHENLELGTYSYGDISSQLQVVGLFNDNFSPSEEILINSLTPDEPTSDGLIELTATSPNKTLLIVVRETSVVLPVEEEIVTEE